MSPRDVETFLDALSTGDRPKLIDGTRADSLPTLFTQFGYTKGAEIGVERGEFSAHLLEQIPDLHLTSVDAWHAYGGYREHVSQEKLEAFYFQTRARLEPFGARSTILRRYSVQAAESIANGSLDFVYIDGNHTLPHVVSDLSAWSPKVRPGGIIAGHDYGRSSVGHVREAVQAWTLAYRIESWYVLSGDRSPSFLWVQK